VSEHSPEIATKLDRISLCLCASVVNFPQQSINHETQRKSFSRKTRFELSLEMILVSFFLYTEQALLVYSQLSLRALVKTENTEREYWD
jgi:hypothetical protein